MLHHTEVVISGASLLITTISQPWGEMPSDVLLVGAVFLLLFTAAMAILYYRRIKKVAKEYKEAKDVIGDIVLSFNKQLQRLEEQFGKVRYKMEALSKRSEDLTIKVNDVENSTTGMASRVSETETRLSRDFENLKKEVSEVTRVQEEIKRHVSETPEAKIEAAIPIKRERALAPLTETELRVLAIIADGSEKTAPEIKDLIKLTREHTARLVKKLYEAGYLERSTEKTPYAYRVKEEMLKILKKVETETKA